MQDSLDSLLACLLVKAFLGRHVTTVCVKHRAISFVLNEVLAA